MRGADLGQLRVDGLLDPGGLDAGPGLGGNRIEGGIEGELDPRLDAQRELAFVHDAPVHARALAREENGVEDSERVVVGVRGGRGLEADHENGQLGIFAHHHAPLPELLGLPRVHFGRRGARRDGPDVFSTSPKTSSARTSPATTMVALLGEYPMEKNAFRSSMDQFSMSLIQPMTGHL